MDKKNYIIILVLALFGFSNLAFAETLLFVGEGCPYCEDVQAYLQENDLYTKFDIQEYEVFNNQENRELYLQKAKELGFENEDVPFLIHNDEAIKGANDIKKYFESAIIDEADEKHTSTLNLEDIKDLNNIIIEEKNNQNKAKTMNVILSIFAVFAISGIIYSKSTSTSSP